MDNIRDIILKNDLLPKEPYIYPMSAIRDEEIFKYFMDKYIKRVHTIIETGTYCGTSSVFLSTYANIVHTFDIVDYKEKYKVWDYFKINQSERSIIFHLIKNDDEKQDQIKDLEKIDFAFIDGRHHGGVDIDFNIIKPYCNKFIFHDYCPSKARKGGKGLYDYVFTYLEDLKKSAKFFEAKEPFMYMEFE